MRHRAILMGVIATMVLGLAIGGVEAKKKTPADGTISLSEGSIAAGIGLSWGKGTLNYKGKHYPISVDGLTVGSVGVAKISATGTVYNLKKLEDFDGTYAAAGAGATVGGGAGVVTMQNQNGVKINLHSTNQGVKLTLGASGVSLKVKQ